MQSLTGAVQSLDGPADRYLGALKNLDPLSPRERWPETCTLSAAVVLSLIVITVENRDSLTEIYGVDTYRKLVHQLTAAIAMSVGRAPRESGELPGSLLMVLPGTAEGAATALGWHVQGAVPREVELGGLLMPVEVTVTVETHDGTTRVVNEPGVSGGRRVISA